MLLGRHLHSQCSFLAHWFLTLAAELGHQGAAERAHFWVPMPEILIRRSRAAEPNKSHGTQ